jgi:hypothetical protein
LAAFLAVDFVAAFLAVSVLVAFRVVLPIAFSVVFALATDKPHLFRQDSIEVFFHATRSPRQYAPVADPDAKKHRQTSVAKLTGPAK